MYVKVTPRRLCQGDIYRDVAVGVPKGSIRRRDEVTVRFIPFDYVIILSQQCDLDRDHEQRFGYCPGVDRLLSAIVVPAFPAERCQSSEFLPELLGRVIGKKEIARYANGEHPRYHVLQGRQDWQIPDLLIDFRMYCSVDIDSFYVEYVASDGHYLGSLDALYRENLSDRFAFYLARIGLPEVVAGGR